MKPVYFATPADFRKWFEKNHETKDELLVGFYKRESGKQSITWPESVDEALCFGWIDGVRRRIDDESYSIRFTPRKKGSTWSRINVAKMEALKKAGKMTPAGLAAYALRTDAKTQIYSYEQQGHDFPDGYEKRLKANKKAWAFFSKQAPWYQRTTKHWVSSAKKEETREKRLALLIERSEAGLPVPQLDRTRPTQK